MILVFVSEPGVPADLTLTSVVFESFNFNGDRLYNWI